MEFGTMCPTDAFGAGHTQPSLGFSAADQRAQIIPCTVGVIGTTRGAAAVLPLVTCNAPNFPALHNTFSHRSRNASSGRSPLPNSNVAKLFNGSGALAKYFFSSSGVTTWVRCLAPGRIFSLGFAAMRPSSSAWASALRNTRIVELMVEILRPCFNRADLKPAASHRLFRPAVLPLTGHGSAAR